MSAPLLDGTSRARLMVVLGEQLAVRGHIAEWTELDALAGAVEAWLDAEGLIPDD